MIVDDQRYARLGLALMIRKAPDLRVVAEAGGARRGGATSWRRGDLVVLGGRWRVPGPDLGP